MGRSLLADAPFTQTVLSFESPGGWGTDPVTGNPVQLPGETVELRAFVSPDRAKQLHLQPGADAHLIPVKVELVSPLTLPEGVGLGSVLTLTWAGTACQLTITSVTPNDLIGVPFGTFLLGEIRPAPP